jgi:phosphoribosyl 1,2-cyclic phosphodiesterase
VEALILASGSSGNAVLVRAGGVSVLVDVGVSALSIQRRLAAFGLEPAVVDGVVVTHEHSDHVCGLEVLLRRHVAAPVWTTAGTWSALDVRSPGGGELASGTTLHLGGLEILPVATSHDAREPVAYRFDDGPHRLALCTDTGIVTPLLAERLAGCDVLLLETNHDADMLRHGPYPWPLKQRIAGRLGHLANHQSAEALDRLRSERLRAVLGLHLSAENNLATLVEDELLPWLPAGAVLEPITRAHMARVTLTDDRAVVERVPVPEPRGRTATRHRL